MFSLCHQRSLVDLPRSQSAPLNINFYSHSAESARRTTSTFTHIVPNPRADDAAAVVLYLQELAETAGIVVAQCFRIAKGLQEGVALEHLIQIRAKKNGACSDKGDALGRGCTRAHALKIRTQTYMNTRKIRIASINTYTIVPENS